MKKKFLLLLAVLSMLSACTQNETTKECPSDIPVIPLESGQSLEPTTAEPASQSGAASTEVSTPGKPSKWEIHLEDTTHGYKDAVPPEIEACIREKVSTFEEECELTDLWYDSEKAEAEIDSYMKYGRGSMNGVKRENVMAVFSDLKTGANTWSFEPNAVYTDWVWILIWEDADSEWVIDDYGY